jgi:tetratricopeptide (TPR) repeat protein
MAKDPWNRYQRGKDLALALYQLKAHLEEQKALEDLGTMVSAAENLPTLKLSNLQELAAMGGPRDTEASPSFPRAMPPVTPPPDEEATRATTNLEEAMSASGSAPLPLGGEGFPASADTLETPLPRAPVRETPPSRLVPESPPPVGVGTASPQDWKNLAKSEVNPRWFWIVSVAALALVVLMVGFFALRARSASRPTVEHDAAMEQEVRERRQALEEGKRLFAAGKYEDSLAKFRQVLARSPNNREARQYAQMAENAVTGRQQVQQKVQQAAQLVAGAKTALSEGRFDEAKSKAEEVLALDASNADALATRDEADRKIAEARVAADAAKKKAAKTKEQQLAKKTAPLPSPVPAPGRVAAAPAQQGPAPAPVPGNATLRLAFESPIPEGHIMVAVNDQILLRKPFSFKKNESRIVTGNLTVASGPAAIKAWFSGPNMPSVFATTNAQLGGGESRTLRIDFAGGALSVRVQ